jgi:hypothetical protein
VNIHAIREHPGGNIQGTFREHSGAALTSRSSLNIQEQPKSCGRGWSKIEFQIFSVEHVYLIKIIGHLQF